MVTRLLKNLYSVEEGFPRPFAGQYALQVPTPMVAPLVKLYANSGDNKPPSGKEPFLQTVAGLLCVRKIIFPPTINKQRLAPAPAFVVLLFFAVDYAALVPSAFSVISVTVATPAVTVTVNVRSVLVFSVYVPVASS